MRWKIVLLIVILISLNLISINSLLASIGIGNLSHKIDTSYTPLQPIKGWINISLANELTNTLISAFNSNITIKQLIEDNEISCTIDSECSCTPTDCEQTYSSINSPFSEKTYSINIATNKLFGIKITESGLVTNITSFKFNVSTNAGKSCLNPLMIDLLDNGIDWRADKISTEECFIEKPYGCYNSSDPTISQVSIDNGKYFCGKINIPEARGFKIGAKIIKTGTATESSTFSLKIATAGVEKTCTNTTNGEIREISCIIDLEQLSNTEAEVCILANAANANTNTYNINFEDSSACGYIKNLNGEIITANNQVINHDYELFAIPLKYKSPAEFEFKEPFIEINPARLVYNYINDKYNGNCINGCIIPIRIYSGINQNLKISNLLVDYDENAQNPVGTIENKSTEIIEAPALMSSEFLKLNLKNNFLTPRTSGKQTLILNIGDKSIKQNITITDITRIMQIVPSQVAFLVPTTFVALLDKQVNNRSNLTFTWNFGDGTIQTINTNSLIRPTSTISLEHTYSVNGTYHLTINVSNISSKTITINAIASYDSINSTILDYRNKLRTVNNKIALLPDWIQTRANQLLTIDDLDSQLDSIENKYKSTLRADQTELTRIMNSLVGLEIPSRLDQTSTIDKLPFFQNENRFNILTIEEFGETADPNRTNKDYYDAINTWLNNNLNITLESKTYSVYYEEEETLFSHVKLVLTPKKDIDVFYVVIEGDLDNIKFKEDYGEKDLTNGYGIRLALSAGQSEIIEFIHPEIIDISNPPVYVSTELEDIELGVGLEIAPAKKYPWKTVILLLGILFFISLIIYIILQEWYKRNYESSLFKDKNQLFNLITFMNSSLIQNLSKNQIFEKLRPLGWSTEQLNYAWRKLHGHRTGMFEIPIFLPFEKMKIRKEIERRTITAGIPPRI